MHSGSVSHWIELFKSGDTSAARPLWERFYEQVLAYARRLLSYSPEQSVDEEDVAQDAFDKLFSALSRGRYPHIRNREDFWRMLVQITKNRAIDQLRKANRERQASDEQAQKFEGYTSPDSQIGINFAGLISGQPSVEDLLHSLEYSQRLIAILRDPILQKIVIWKMEGYTNEQIAEKLNCSRRTVIRKLELIRRIWGKEWME